MALGTVSNVLNRPDKVAASHPASGAGRHRGAGLRPQRRRPPAAGRTSRTLGLVVLDVGNPFFTDLARGAEDRAAEEGLSVLLGNSDETPERESTYMDLFEEQRVLGLLISPIGDVYARLQRLAHRGTPTVLVDRRAEGRSFSSVSVDDVAGGYLAVSHLIEQGCTRIAFVGGPLNILQVADRLEGATRSVAENPGVTLEVLSQPGLTRAQRQVGRAS